MIHQISLPPNNSFLSLVGTRIVEEDALTNADKSNKFPDTLSPADFAKSFRVRNYSRRNKTLLDPGSFFPLPAVDSADGETNFSESRELIENHGRHRQKYAHIYVLRRGHIHRFNYPWSSSFFGFPIFQLHSTKEEAARIMRRKITNCAIFFHPTKGRGYPKMRTKKTSQVHLFSFVELVK